MSIWGVIMTIMIIITVMNSFFPCNKGPWFIFILSNTKPDRQGIYLKNEIFLRTQIDWILWDIVLLLTACWSNYEEELVPVADYRELFERFPGGGLAALPKFMWVWRCWLGFCSYSLMVLLWAFKWSTSAVDRIVASKNKFLHPNLQNLSILSKMAQDMIT